MNPIPVYCEHGAYDKRLSPLKAGNRIEIVHFPLETKSRHTQIRPTPSDSTWEDMVNITWDNADFTWEGTEGSEIKSAICHLIGANNRRDADHVDAAYKHGCVCFLTNDRGDILSRKDQLKNLTGMKFFDLGEEFDRFIEFLKELEAQIDAPGVR